MLSNEQIEARITEVVKNHPDIVEGELEIPPLASDGFNKDAFLKKLYSANATKWGRRPSAHVVLSGPDRHKDSMALVDKRIDNALRTIKNAVAAENSWTVEEYEKREAQIKAFHEELKTLEVPTGPAGPFIVYRVIPNGPAT